MSDDRTGIDLAADFHELWIAAQSLRKMANAHTEASNAVSGCYAFSAFLRPAGVTSTTDGCYDKWAALRGAIDTMLDSNAKSLRDCGAALDLCIKTYRATDEAARTEFEARKKLIPYDSYVESVS